MTYLQLVNKVLRELREATVSDLASTYSNLIGQFINEAKSEVESAWKWKALRTNVTFNTVSGTQDYNLGTAGVGSGGTTTERSKLIYDSCGDPQVFVTTSGYERRLTEVPREKHRAWIAEAQMGNQAPAYFSLSKSNTGITLSLYPKPNGVYAIQTTFYIPQAELSTTTTEISCPAEPVWRLALAYAASERGGGQSENADRLLMRAEHSLRSYIAEEAEQAELSFYEV